MAAQPPTRSTNVTKLAFLDLETTGLDPARHEIWEIGLILRTHVDLEIGQGYTETEHLWRIEPMLPSADPTGLRIGRYYERTAEMVGYHERQTPNLTAEDAALAWSDPVALARLLARMLDGAHIVGAVPSFDAAFLARWLPSQGQAFTAHYHLIDVEALVVGYVLGAGQATPSLPWNSNDLSRTIGVDPDAYERHTALGDARWVRDQYDAVTDRHAEATR
jgi:hypothetical protein